MVTELSASSITSGNEAKKIISMRYKRQSKRQHQFASKSKRVVLIAYAYGRTGDNPRGVYLVPLRAFRENKIYKTVADKKYRIEQNAESFAQYIENYFAALFAKSRE